MHVGSYLAFDVKQAGVLQNLVWGFAAATADVVHGTS